MGKPEQVGETSTAIFNTVFPGGQVPDDLYALAEKLAVLVRSLARPFQGDDETDNKLLAEWNAGLLLAGDNHGYIAGEIARACLRAKGGTSVAR